MLTADGDLDRVGDRADPGGDRFVRAGRAATELARECDHVLVLGKPGHVEVLGLSEDLPSDPANAKQLVLARFQRMDTQLSSELKNAAKGLAQAMQYGINRYPAIVFDGDAVVYGVTDVSAATQLFQRWQTRGERQ